MKPFIIKILKGSLVTVSILSLISLWSFGSYYVINAGMNDNGTQDSSEVTKDEGGHECNVYGLRLRGELVTYHMPESYSDNGKLIADETSGDDVYRIIKDAEANEKVKYVLTEIDSPGGTVDAGFEIMSSIKGSKKPVVAFARNGIDSGAYLAATGAQTIFASAVSEVGSIGVTGSYLSRTKKNEKDGLTYIELTAGKFKDTNSPDRPVTDEEKKLLLRDVNILYEHFVRAVADNRKLDINNVRKIADGSTMLGEAALKNGLIDKIGNIYDAENFVKEKVGSDIHVCWQN